MNELIIILALFFWPIIFYLKFAFVYIRKDRPQLILLNQKYAPFLFVFCLFLAGIFHLTPAIGFLEWLGVSSTFTWVMLIFTVVDNVFIFFIKEHRVEKIVKLYKNYLASDIGEFSLVVLLSFLSAVLILFRVKSIFFYPQILSILVFFFLLIFLPLLLNHYKKLTFQINTPIKYEKLVTSTAKILVIFMSYLLFTKLLHIFYISATDGQKIILIALLAVELTIFILLNNKVLNIPPAVANSRVFLSTKNKLLSFAKNLSAFLYGHLEITSVILLLAVFSLPVIAVRVSEYQVWRSNFPIIKKALPAIGMQGTVIVLFGNNFGTTGEGVPGKVLIGNTALLVSEWNDHQIAVSIPVPPPQGEIYIKKNFKWKARNYTADSNKIKFVNFDWGQAKQKDIERYLEVLKSQYEIDKKN